ncbi:MAG: RNA polymerase sigma-54 factor [Candidatus Puniceispirillum sp.]|nr:RNA polymerase sigma-54 factor [Candidatus Pelagibacter sp.]MBA4283056.1 RNA polymerase sigma-54 factor [Candidatus Puniceispirillum sp.]
MIRNEISLKLRQGSQLVLTTRLQQAIHLLQFSADELNDFVLNQVMENPLLELYEEGKTQTSESEEEKFSDDYGNNGDAHSNTSQQEYGLTSEKPLWNSPLSFHHFVTHQIYQTFNNERHQEIAFYFFHNLNEDGFLNSHWKNAYEIFKDQEHDIDFVLTKLKNLEPIGIFAQDIYESFRIQIRLKDDYYANIYRDEQIQNYIAAFKLLQKMDLSSVCKQFTFKENDFIKFLKILKNLDFHPARNFENQFSDIQTRCPDIVISKNQYHDLDVRLNPQSLPKVIVNSSYFNELKKKFNSSDDLDYLKDKFYAANWLIQSLQKRAITMLKVSQAVAKIQNNFFCNVGPLVPMTLKDVSQLTDLHESTVSRISTSKTLDTPRGIMNLKSLFSNLVGNMASANSSIEIQNAIKDIVFEEPKDRPLSDEDLVELLNTKGFDIARRTVSKYRTILGIASSSQRKKIYRAHASCEIFS